MIKVNKAHNCKYCQTDKYLMLKTYNEKIFWIHCDKCGQTGLACATIALCGENWNKQQEVQDVFN